MKAIIILGSIVALLACAAEQCSADAYTAAGLVHDGGVNKHNSIEGSLWQPTTNTLRLQQLQREYTETQKHLLRVEGAIQVMQAVVDEEQSTSPTLALPPLPRTAQPRRQKACPDPLGG